MIALGPVDPLREAAASQLLPRARLAGQEAGVTRLADITRLDRLGLPVWQAVRPMSRALSVHQGKGATDTDAQVGALLEAVESHCAEVFEAENIFCAFQALPEHGRAPTIADFASETSRVPCGETPVRWVEAPDLITGDAIYLPFDLVSLDLSRNVPSRFDRASNGVATGASREEAIATALHELIERDAVTEWRASNLMARMEATLELDTVGFRWLGLWRERLAAAGAAFRCYVVPSIIDTPVFACEINDRHKDGAPYRAIHGRGCHPVPEIALFKAVAEAIQGRATYIAGARDDLLPAQYLGAADAGIMIAFGLPLPPGMNGVDFNSVAAGPLGAPMVATALEEAGYGRIAVVELGRPQGLWVVRAFVCGLGGMVRRRRAPPS